MNNDFLAGILSGSTGPITALQTGKKQNGSETGDFMSLLQNRLAFDADAISGSKQSKINFSFRNSSGTGNINPLLINSAETRFLSEEKPAVAITSERIQENDVRSEATAPGKTDETSRKESHATESSENTKEASEKEVDEEKAVDGSQETAKNAQVAKDQSGDMQSIESLLAQFTPEEQQNLINALQKLSPEDLQALAESPEGFQNKLAELIADMPESEEQASLLELVNRPEFQNLLTEISNALQVVVPVQETAATAPDIEVTTVEDSEATSQLAATALNSENSVEEGSGADNTESAEESELTEINGDEATGQETSGQEMAAVSAGQQPTQIEKDVSTDEKAVTEATETAATATANVNQEAAASENAESETDSESASEGKESQNQEKTSAAKADYNEAKAEMKEEYHVERESLRQEFKRMNESGEEPVATDADTGNSENSTTSQNHAQTGVNPAAASEVKPAIEEAARRFFSLLCDKGSGNNSKAENQVFSASTVENVRKSVHTTSSSGNGGLSNGYGYQSGNTASTNSAARVSNPMPVTTAAFAELLDKAEFVKTKNGSKVLNIELDPKELGKMEMELTSKDGAVTARISADNALAKAKLEELAPQIKEQLVNQGVNLTEITVDISSRDSDGQNGNQENGGHNKSSRISASTNNKEDADTIIRKNILPNLRRAALNIQSVDMTV